MIKHKGILILFLALIFVIPLLSAVPPQESSTGFNIRAGIESYVQKDTFFDTHLHVFDVDTGLPVTDGIGCYVHLYSPNGTHLFEGYDETVGHNFDYAFEIEGGNFSEIGTRLFIAQCNGTFNAEQKGGFYSQELEVNGYGEELITSLAINFNFAMVFLIILFVLGIIGIFVFENPAGKLACFWFSYVLFVVGNFSVWQFNEGYTLAYMGMASTFKVLFYVSIIGMFPLVLLSLAWIFYIHVMNDDMKKMMDRGMDEDEAYSRARRKNKW